MGSFFSNFIAIRPNKVLLLGLDNAGKTSLIYQSINKFTYPGPIHTRPTIGFNVRTLQIGAINCVVWDMAGQTKSRGLWKHYVRDTDALIFMVDISDQERYNEALGTLESILLVQSDRTGTYLLEGIPVLVLLNKIDQLPHTMPVDMLVKRTELFMEKINNTTADMRKPNPFIVTPSQCRGDNIVGVKEGFSWIEKELRKSMSFLERISL